MTVFLVAVAVVQVLDNCWKASGAVGVWLKAVAENSSADKASKDTQVVAGASGMMRFQSGRESQNLGCWVLSA